MESICNELVDTSENAKVKCLKKCPDSENFMINSDPIDNDEDRELFVYLGAILAFSFLSGQCFDVKLATAVWK